MNLQENISRIREVMKLNEQYNSEQLYKRETIVNFLKKAPRELRHYVTKLPKIPCENNNGEKSICTKIPEVIYVYLKGNY